MNRRQFLIGASTAALAAALPALPPTLPVVFDGFVGAYGGMRIVIKGSPELSGSSMSAVFVDPLGPKQFFDLGLSLRGSEWRWTPA